MHRRAAFPVRMLATVLTLVVSLAAGLALRTAIAQDATPAPPPETSGDFSGLVDIGGGRRLWLECRGAGSPTVILEAGAGNNGQNWDAVGLPPSSQQTAVLPGVAAFTRVCAYDRPGTILDFEHRSRSDPAPMPRDAGDVVADLHALLTAAAVPGPYVLAGHSTGGLIVRLYAATHPDRVAGLVQVDALSEQVQDALTHLRFVAFDRLNNGPVPGLGGYRELERILFAPSFLQVRRALAARPAGPLPAVVISRGRPQPLPPGLPAGLTTRVLERAWRAAQDALAASMPGADRVIARRSSHYVMFSQPRVVAGAVRRVVAAVRAG